MGLPKMLLWLEKVDAVDEGRGLKYAWPGGAPGSPPRCVDGNGLTPDGTDSRRPPGVAGPHMLDGRDEGDCKAELKPGLVGPVEKVDEVGVL